MKKIFVLMLIAGILFAASTANAESWSDNFNDSVMDESLWWRMNADINLPPAAQALNEIGGVLQWNPTTSYSGGEHYCSTWTVGFDNDFKFRADFYAPVNGLAYKDESMVHIAMARLDANGDPGFLSLIETGGEGTATSDRAFFKAMIGEANGEEYFVEGADRDIVEGWIGMRYTASTDLMEFGAFDLGEPDTGTALWSTEYAGFTADFGDDPMNIGIGGWAEVGVFGAPMMYLDNFEGCVTPEPVSMVLFGVGAGCMGLFGARRRKKFNQ